MAAQTTIKSQKELNPTDHPAGTSFLTRPDHYKKHRSELVLKQVVQWSSNGTAWCDGSVWLSDMPLVFDVVVFEPAEEIVPAMGIKPPTKSVVCEFLGHVAELDFVLSEGAVPDYLRAVAVD